MQVVTAPTITTNISRPSTQSISEFYQNNEMKSNVHIIALQKNNLVPDGTECGEDYVEEVINPKMPTFPLTFYNLFYLLA